MIGSPEGNVVVDWRRNLGGRGANVCPTRTCVETAVAKRRFNQTLKSELNYPKAEDLLETMGAVLERQLETLLRSSMASRHVVAGAQFVRQALEVGRIFCIIAAEDSARREEFVARSAAAGVPMMMVSSKEKLGAIAGRKDVGVVAIDNEGLAQAICSVMGRLEALR